MLFVHVYRITLLEFKPETSGLSLISVRSSENCRFMQSPCQLGMGITSKYSTPYAQVKDDLALAHALPPVKFW